jgi:alpha-1,2-mannosyltransferase
VPHSLGVPLALYILYDRSLWYLLKWSIVSGMLCLVPSVLIDSYHYKKFTIAPLNIVLYNVFSGGSELYGVEPWYYYIMNGFLNFNVVLFFALAVLFVLIAHCALNMKELTLPSAIGQNFYRPLIIHSPMLIWFTFMSAIAHKVCFCITLSLFQLIF